MDLSYRHLPCMMALPTYMTTCLIDLSRRSINMFSELWVEFVSQYLFSVRHKRNISSLQTILKQEDESICDFTRRFFLWGRGGGGGGGGGVKKIDSYSMDAVLQNFRKSFRPTTPFFHSLSLDPPMTMEELYRRADRYSTLEDNIRAAS